jgi:hypothetical protein
LNGAFICDTGGRVFGLAVQVMPVLLSLLAIVPAVWGLGGDGPSASPVAADRLTTRLRLAWSSTKWLGALTAVLFVPVAFVFVATHIALGEEPPNAPPHGPSGVWLEISSIGTLAAGLGAVASAVAALIAVRMSATARKTSAGQGRKPRATGSKPGAKVTKDTGEG